MPQRDNLSLVQQGDVIDESGRSHRICWTGHTTPLIVDGEPSTITIDHQDAITFSTRVGAFTCSSEAFWFSFAGPGMQPTAQEGGRYLAHTFASWMRVRSMQEQVRDALNAIVAQPMDEIPLPSFQVDPLVAQVLQLDDGTHQTRVVLVQLLRRLGQTALAALPPVLTPSLLGTTAGETKAVVADVQTTKEPERRQTSRFTTEQLDLMEQAYHQAAPGTYRALAARLAQEWKCEASAVYSAFYTRGLAKQKRNSASGREKTERSGTEDH